MKNRYFWSIAGDDIYKVAFVKAKQEVSETNNKELVFQTYYNGEFITFCGKEQ